jgi:argininosuccinate synthase
MPDVKKVALAYSGGLDTSVILRWLIEHYRCEVVAFCAGPRPGRRADPRPRQGARTGAAASTSSTLREEFVRDFIFPMLRANAVYEGSYLLGTSIARPLIAQGPGRGGGARKAPTRSLTAPPARATTRCASS